MEISKIKIPGIQDPLDIKDTVARERLDNILGGATKNSISANTSSSCSITGSENAGKSETVIYVNSGSADVTVTVPTTYSTPNGAAIELTCPVGGYCEISYLNIGGVIYARGL